MKNCCAAPTVSVKTCPFRYVILHNNRLPQRSTHHRPHPAQHSGTDVDRFRIYRKRRSVVRRYATGRYRLRNTGAKIYQRTGLGNIRRHEPCYEHGQRRISYIPQCRRQFCIARHPVTFRRSHPPTRLSGHSVRSDKNSRFRTHSDRRQTPESSRTVVAEKFCRRHGRLPSGNGGATKNHRPLRHILPLFGRLSMEHTLPATFTAQCVSRRMRHTLSKRRHYHSQPL